MTEFESASLTLQNRAFAVGVLTLIVGFGVLLVYFFQMRAMQNQLRISRDSATFDHVVALMGFLQTSDIRTARSRIIKEVKGKAYSNWSKDELADASTVCSSYSAAGYVLMELVEKEPKVINAFAAGWSPSIRICYEILEPHILEMRRLAKSDDYWKGFEWLRNHAPATAR